MKEPHEYLKLGYVDDGYVCPELTSESEYPDYIEETVLDAINRIKKHENENTFSFGFMTDIHHDKCHKSTVRAKRLINAYKEIAKEVKIDKLLLGGDYTNEGCKQYKSECFEELREIFSGINYYPVNGNHDDGSIWDKAFIKADKSTNHLTHEDLFKLFYNHLPNIGAELDKTNSDGLYYLLNDETNKTRYVFIDSCDVPYIFDEKGLLKYYPQWLFAMSQKQIDWLLNKALSFDEEGWSVIFVTHSVLSPSADKTNPKLITLYLDLLNQITCAYKKGEDIHKTFDSGDFERRVDADFSKRIRADIIGFFVGDYHRDIVERNEADIPYIMTSKAVVFIPPNNQDYDRKDGDKSEILFDIVTIDKKDRKIYTTRVGIGEDRVVEY